MPSVRPAEARALEVARLFRSETVLAVTEGRPIAARQIAAEWPEARVGCWFRDVYRAGLAAQGDPPANLKIECASDPPAGAVGLALLSFSMQGEAELTRETLQEAAARLVEGGVLVAATNNPRDRWLAQQVEKALGPPRVHAFDDAVVYTAMRRGPLGRLRDFACEIVFRDRGRLLTAVSRPGVFSHRRVDPGARRLMDTAEVGFGELVLDLGCGAGTVAIALAAREPSARVHAVDSDTRAVACTQRGAALCGLTNVTAELSATGPQRDAGGYDLVVTNPPYYAGDEIAARMLAAALRALRPAGRLVVVTKHANWYEEHLPAEGWRDVSAHDAKGYTLFLAQKAT